MNKCLFFICIVVSCTNVNRILEEEKVFGNINEGDVLTSFYRAGSTSMTEAYHHNEKNHCQQKITEIQKVIELCNSIDCECFSVTENKIININRLIECQITLEQYLNINE
jgi:hypothetical protein